MTVDICYGGCGGIWFDADELDRLNARAATTLHSIWQAPVEVADLARERICPRCPKQVLERKWFSDVKQVEIDQCPTCRGIWLDAGEFSRVYAEIKGAKVAPPGWASVIAEAAALVNEKGATEAREPQPSIGRRSNA